MQAAGIKFTHSLKIRFFAPHARETHDTDSCETWRDRRARGSVWLCKLSPQSAQGGGGVGMQPQNMRNFHFLVESPGGAF